MFPMPRLLTGFLHNEEKGIVCFVAMHLNCSLYIRKFIAFLKLTEHIFLHNELRMHPRKKFSPTKILVCTATRRNHQMETANLWISSSVDTFGAIEWAEEMVQISSPFSCVLYILCPAFPMQCFYSYQMLTYYATHKLWIAIILKWLLYQDFPTHINNSTSGVILDK